VVARRRRRGGGGGDLQTPNSTTNVERKGRKDERVLGSAKKEGKMDSLKLQSADDEPKKGEGKRSK